MQPFGLFQFLSSLLQNPPSAATEHPNEKSACEPQKDDAQADEKNEDRFSTSENACLQFLAAHDARAGKFRK